MGRHELELQARIRAPADKVWSVLADPKSYPKWMRHIQRVESRSKTLKEGTRFKLMTKTTHHELSSEVEVTECEPPKRLAWRSVEELMDGKPFEHVSDVETEFELEGDGKATTVHVYGGFVARSLRAKLGAAFLLQTKVKPELERALDELKKLCE